jgi:hypothetical protein
MQTNEVAVAPQPFMFSTRAPVDMSMERFVAMFGDSHGINYESLCPELGQKLPWKEALHYKVQVWMAANEGKKQLKEREYVFIPGAEEQWHARFQALRNW